MNLAEKIIQNHLVSGNMKPGSEISLRIDQTLTQDALGTIAYLAFESLGIPKVKTSVSVSYIDHNMLYIDNKNPDDHAYLTSVAQKYGILLSRAGNGICHHVHISRFARPGELLIGGDSHTPSCGALGMMGIGAGGMDVAAAMAGCPITIKMPEIINIYLTGTFSAGVSAKDLALEITRRLTAKGGLNKILEYSGPALEFLSVPQRMTIANMGAEVGATSSIFPSDVRVLEFLSAQKRLQDFKPLAADPDSTYSSTIHIDLGQIESLVSVPSQPDKVVKAKELVNVKVDQVFIGSCTNSSYSDFKKAAVILKDKVIPPDVSLVVSPGSRQIYKMLLQDGIIETFLLSGARILECCCGPCVGMGQAVKTNGVSVRTSNRNYKGRSGTSDAQVYLASPEVAAATAVNGYISTPDQVIDPRILMDIKEPDNYYIDDSMIIVPPADGSKVEIARGPNIRPIPQNEPVKDSLHVIVSIKAGENVSTDEIAPAGPEISALRANIPAAAKTSFSRIDPDFFRRTQIYGESIIVAGENFGQGSSREHAALLPMYLGVKSVLAKSFARIFKNNLINCGILPLEFECFNDYDHIGQGDALILENLYMQLKCGEVKIINKTKNREICAKCRFTDREKNIILSGGLMNAIRLGKLL
jgi:aconitate hydratase